MATVHLPRSLVTLFTDPPPRHVDVDATSLAELVSRLDESWPGMRDRLCEPGPQIREHINVFIDGERERDLGATIAPSAVVHIIPAVAGGAQGRMGTAVDFDNRRPGRHYDGRSSLSVSNSSRGG